MKKLLLLGAVFLMVLFAGCVGGEQPAGEETTDMEEGTTVTTQEPTEETTEPTEEVDMVETLADALAQSVPMECTSSYIAYNQVEYTTHSWIKDGNVRHEVDTEEGTSVIIFKDDKTYMEAGAYGQDVPDCDWIVFEMEEESDVEQPDQFSYSTEMVSNPEKYSVECHAAVFGDEKFATPGETCTFEELFQLPPEFDACSGLTGQALTDCLSAQYQ